MAAFYSKRRSGVFFAFVLAFALATLGAAKWPDPERLAPEIRAFARADSALPPPAGAVVCVGSSSIRMWHPTLARDLAPLTVVPRGFGGSTMEDLERYLEPLVLAVRPRAVLLYEGDNDLLEGVSPGEIAAVLDTILTRIRTTLPGTRVYVLSIKPSPSRRALWPRAAETNARFREACARDSLLHYVDVAGAMLDRNGQPGPELFGPDSLHMSGAGYAVWTRVVRPVLLGREARFERAAGDSARQK